MTITTELTARDKKLLIFLAIFLVVVGFVWFLIKPTYDEITQLDTDLTAARMLQNENRYKINQIGRREELLQNSADILSEEAKKLYPMMTNQDIDQMLTLKALSFGFNKSDLRELTITGDDEYLQISPYLDDRGKKEIEPLTGIYAAEVSFCLYGQRDALQRFYNQLINENEQIRITKFGWDHFGRDGNVYTLTLQLQLIMSDAAEVIEQLPASADDFIAAEEAGEAEESTE